MDIQATAERFAEMKLDLKLLTTQIKEVQQELLDDGVATDIETENGKLVFTVRENYKVNNQPGVQDAIGSQGVQDAMDKNLIAIKSVSEYFTLK